MRKAKDLNDGDFALCLAYLERWFRTCSGSYYGDA
jgi:hypothetical protein